MDDLDFTRGDAQEEQPRRVAKRSRKPFLILAVVALLAVGAVTAAVLLLPGDCGANGFRAETVVTYGLSPRDSITFSSLREPVLCVQRTLPLLCGGVLEPQEFPLPGVEGAERLLPGVGTRLLWTGSPYPL